MQVKILAEGGSMSPSPALSQQLGPAGINIGQVISKVNAATSEFKGLKVPVELDINIKTKEFQIKVFSPPVSELLKKELGITKASGEQKKVKVANASIEQIISVAKRKFPSLLCKDLKSAVKTVVGTCVAMGVLVENKPASEIEKDISEGKYDKEINSEITETPSEKKKELQEYFSKIQKEQDRIIKQEAAAKEAESAKAESKAVPEKPVKEVKK